MSYSVNCFFQGLILKIQIKLPRTAIKHQILKVNCQPIFSDSIAIPKVEIPLPTYAQAFNMPATVEIFPYFLKNGGTIEVSIADTPCIAPVSSDEQTTDSITELPEL